MLYSPSMLRYFYHTPHAWEAVENPSEAIRAQKGLPINGDQVEYWLTIALGRVVRCVYRIRARAVTMACAEYCADFCEGKNLPEVLALSSGDIVEALQLPRTREHSAALVLSALHQAVRDYQDGTESQSR